MEKRISLRDCRDGIELDVPKGYFMCWNFTTQAYNRVIVKMYDNRGNVYLKETRQSMNPEPMISGSGYMTGDKLFLQVDVPASNRVEIRKNMWDITDEGNLLARSIVLLAEDAYDYDFNDIQFNITAYKNRG